jgi:hypothetical protein
MSGNVTGINGPGGLSGILLIQKLLGVKGPSSSGGATGAAGTSGAGQSTASISGPGQLLSNLQQLQAQNPASFQAVVTQIAGQLQAAAQQTQGPQSKFLSDLAARFQNVANGGPLSQLQPHRHHHHHSRAQQAYGRNTSAGVAGLGQAGSSSSSGSSSLQQLFATISSEVSTALAG